MELMAGAIAFVAFSFSNPDSFEVVALVDIPPGTVIYFTDRGWGANNSLRANEGTFTWMAPAGGVTAGTVIEVDAPTGVALSTSGDQILAYQGAAASPSFLAGLHSDGLDWNADATSANTSALPLGLTNGMDAIAIPEVNNGRYNGSVTSGSREVLLAAINDPDNWVLDNNNRQDFTDSFTVTSAPPASNADLISGIQGSGDTSPRQGDTVTIEGIVVGDFQAGDSDSSRDLGGFYVQEENGDVDGDAATSEGIFVFDSEFGTDVSLGDTVRVTGTVDEFFGETQIGNITAVTRLNSNNPLPTAAVIELPAARTSTTESRERQPDLEAFEGMRVVFPTPLTVTEMFQLDRLNEIKLSQGGRLEQFTQNNPPSVAGYAAHLENIARRTIIYDDGRSSQNVPIENLDGFGPVYNTATTVRMGDTITGLSGVLDYKQSGRRLSERTWRVRSVADGTHTFTRANSRTSAPDPVGGRLTVASLNVLNFFTTLDRPGATTDTGADPRGADNPDEFARQLTKLTTAILAMDADVYGLVELENSATSAALATLVAELNAQTAPGTYGFVNTGLMGGDAIAVGFLYKTATVSPLGDFAVLNTPDFLDPNNSGSPRNRPALAQTFQETATGELFTPVVNHFKSKGPSRVDPNSADAAQGDGQGNWNNTRTQAAIALANWLATDPTASGDSDVLILGDLNAYAQEDPLTALARQGYTDLAQQFLGDDAYSFVFNGQIGTLDYALANASLLSQITGVTEWHVNADEPDAIDYNLDFRRNPDIFDGSVPYRNADHDPVLVGLNLR
ncbi:MAG: ExeM/NucH family extracellular endonuclease [Cyanobacteria bacterium P01_A01_bin.105]